MAIDEIKKYIPIDEIKKDISTMTLYLGIDNAENPFSPDYWHEKMNFKFNFPHFSFKTGCFNNGVSEYEIWNLFEYLKEKCKAKALRVVINKELTNNNLPSCIDE